MKVLFPSLATIDATVLGRDVSAQVPEAHNRHRRGAGRCSAQKLSTMSHAIYSTTPTQNGAAFSCMPR